MVLKKLWGQADLFGAQTLCTYETTKIVMIRKDKHPVLTAVQVVALCFEGFNNSQKLTVVSFILYFCWNYFPQKKRY